jgi:hypothetical protein
MKMRFCLAPIAFLLMNIPSGFSGNNCFPAENQILRSPSGAYELSWEKGNLGAKDIEPHRLFFRRKGEKELHKILEFHNQACVHWSPNENYFTISHFIGSNIAEDYIFRSKDLSYRVDALDLLPDNIRNYFREGILHSYIETIAWNQKGLLIRAWGDRENEPRTFDVTLKCTIEQNRWVCRNTAN